MKFFKSLLCAGLVMFGQTAAAQVEKAFMQGPHNNYLMNSSSLFLPTDYLPMNTPVSDARTVVIHTGVVGGLDSMVPTGVECRAFRDSFDNDDFYQMWHFAHIDNIHKRTNVVTIIVSVGDIRLSPSGDIEDLRRRLNPSLVYRIPSRPPSNYGDLQSSESVDKVYVQVYRTWSIPSTIPLTQSDIDGWWHSITHAFHTAMHIWNEVKPWIGVARTVLPILVSLDDAQPGLGLKSVAYSPEPQSTTTSSSSSTENTNSDKVFTYSLTPGEMAAVVICVFISGAALVVIVPKMWNKQWNGLKINRLNRDLETRASTPLV